MKCYICRELFPDEDIIEHHIDYETDNKIFVCVSCHADIHRSNSYPAFKPKQERPKKTKSGGYISLYLPSLYYKFLKVNIKDINKWFRKKLDEEREKYPTICKENIKYWQQKLKNAEKGD